LSKNIPLPPTRRAFFELHLAVFLYGLTAILGDLISLPATILVWWRVLITSISLLFFIGFGRALKDLPRKLILEYICIGFIVALHWITFFGAIKYANASVALVCYATGSLFTSCLEPLILKQKFKWYEMALGAIIVPGMMLIVSSLDGAMLFGVGLGLLSSFLSALFSVLNKLRIDRASPMVITFLEMSSSWLFISLILPFYFMQMGDLPFWPTQMDWIYLGILALLCTTFAYVLNLRALKYLSAFTANLALNMEPVYGIILAAVLLQENKELSPNFYFGVLIILAAVFGYPLLKKQKPNVQT
jgi:drug/metabolite transporter (DMT)-like permease